MDKALVRIMLELTPHPALVVDRDGSVLAANGSGQALFDLSLLGRDVQDVLSFEPHSWNETALTLKSPVFFLECGLRNAVADAPELVMLRALSLPGGAMVLMLLDRRGSDGPLLDFRQTEQRYRAIFENAPVGIFTSTSAGRFIDVNQTLATMLGFSTPQEVVDGIEDIAQEIYVNPEKRDEIVEIIRQSPGLAIFENDYYRRDGSTFTARINVSVLDDPVHGGKYILGMVDDITDRKRAEKELHESREMFHSIFANAPVGIFLATIDGSFLSINPQLVSMYGYDSIEGFLQKCEGLYSSFFVQSQSCQVMMDALLERGSVSNFELLSRRRDGSEFWTSCNVRLMRDEEGRPEHIKAFVSDISEQKELERLREDVERITRHDLKSPLTSCILGARMLRKDENITLTQQEILREMERSGARMLRMINLSLDIYKMETGSYELKPTEVDLLGVLRRAAAEAMRSEHHKSLTLLLRSGGQEADKDSSFMISAEELLCHSLFANLLLNAFQASPEGETVTVDLDPDKGRVCVAIHNKGAVPDEVRPHFFSKYATAGKRYGTGLGTYSARLIVQTHGGSVDFETSDEQGTTVRVYLPIEASH